MTYLTDNPWPLLILLGGIAVVAFLSGSPRGRGIAGLCLLLGVGVYFLEQYLISTQEEVEAEVQTMLDHFKARDLTAISGQICADSEELTAVAAKGLKLVQLSDSFHIKSVQVTLQGDERTATAMVRANGELTLTNGGGTHRVPNYWKTVWQHEGDRWKLAEVTRLNPVNGTKMGYFSAQ